jgi:hypothetical protein
MAGKDLNSRFKMAEPDCGWVLAESALRGVGAINDMAKFRGTEYSEHCRGSSQTGGGKAVSQPPLVLSSAKVQHLGPFYLKGFRAEAGGRAG